MDSITAEEFEDIYAEFGYVAADSRDPNSLSYLYKVDSSLWLLMLDSCQYDPVNQVGGMIQSGTYKWMEPILYEAWENDTEIWGVSGTLAPFSRHTLERFIEEQQFDIFQTRQQRLIIETPEGLPVGALDLFDLDPVNLRAGVGILIHDTAQRGKGYAADAVETVCSYARDMLHLHQLWCSVEAGNAASLALFRHAGFSETGIRKEWLRLADGFHDEVFLQKIL